MNHLTLIDGSGYIFRAYFALPPMNRADGTPTNAVYGFSGMIMNLLEVNQSNHFAVIFDAKRKNFRNEIYPDYKGHRPDAPEDLIPQFDLIKDAVRAFDLPCLELEGYEADDLIASYAKSAKAQGMKVTIVSSDKDLMQLVKEGIELWDPVKNRTIDEAAVFEKFGVGPDKVIDVQALAGDSSDNVPGVPGIGVKTAAQLIHEYGDLEGLLSHADEIKQPKRRQALLDNAELARISKQLVTLDENAPQPLAINELNRQKMNSEKVRDFFVENGFKRLLGRIGEGHNLGRDDSVNPSFQGNEKNKSQQDDNHHQSVLAPPYEGYSLITKEEDLKAWCEEIRNKGLVAVDTETTGLHIMQDRLVGISLATAPGRACYIPLIYKQANHSDLFEEKSEGDVSLLPLEMVIKYLKPILEDAAIMKIGQNMKFDHSILKAVGIDIHPFHDTMLMSFALSAGKGKHGMDDLSLFYLKHKPVSFEEIAGKGAKKLRFDEIEITKAAHYAAEDADITLRLYFILKPLLQKQGMVRFYEVIERPLAPVIAAMERTGILIDVKRLKELDSEFKSRMENYAQHIYELAGEEFNIASPQQMGEVLFDKLNLPSSKKTDGGARSTNVSVLEPLAKDYPIVADILHWRMLAKLRSTYCESLIEAAHPQTMRVHSSFSMIGAQTGRLSSSDPNLQNIPIRTEEGRMIRSAFIAPEDHLLLAIDYSQIELRLLAEIADIQALKQAFANGQDIHAATAAEVFNTPLNQVDSDLRRKAKAINFGIVYGISAHGLSQQINVSRVEAQDFINRYFEKFPGIRHYMQDKVASCKELGFVETIFGRRLYIRAINDSNWSSRSGAERVAINAPIQGSAADVIKRAMIKIPGVLKQNGLENVKMLLQVHDELLFEVPKQDIERATEILSNVMEQATQPFLDLPLKVEAGHGQNWSVAH